MPTRTTGTAGQNNHHAAAAAKSWDSDPGRGSSSLRLPTPPTKNHGTPGDSESADSECAADYADSETVRRWPGHRTQGSDAGAADSVVAGQSPGGHPRSRVVGADSDRKPENRDRDTGGSDCEPLRRRHPCQCSSWAGQRRRNAARPGRPFPYRFQAEVPSSKGPLRALDLVATAATWRRVGASATGARTAGESSPSGILVNEFRYDFTIFFTNTNSYLNVAYGFMIMMSYMKSYKFHHMNLDMNSWRISWNHMSEFILIILWIHAVDSVLNSKWWNYISWWWIDVYAFIHEFSGMMNIVKSWDSWLNSSTWLHIWNHGWIHKLIRIQLQIWKFTETDLKQILCSQLTADPKATALLLCGNWVALLQQQA